MTYKQQVTDKKHSAANQSGTPPQSLDANAATSPPLSGSDQDGDKAQPRRISQQEAQSIPVDPDPDDPVSP